MGACSGGLEPATDEAALTRLVPEERAGPVPTPLASQPSYAQAVDSTSTAGVLQPAQALGPPDGQAALVLSLPGAALVLDMGEGTEGTGDLEVSYRNATVEVLTWVEFLRADKSVISTGPLRLANLELGTHTTTVPYQDKPVPYRYVRMTGVLALYGVDAVRNMGSDGITCGDGQPNEGETCDDANRTSGDGCSRDCQKEAGFRCESTPSVCTDIDECAERLDNCAAGFSCINRPGSFFCWEGVCRPPHSVCGNQCFNLYTDKENCGRCGNRCGWRDVCARGVCKTIGKLAFTLSWSRPGNGDLIVRAPGGIHYSAQNPGPEGQELFVFDDQDGKGPEVVYWAPGVEPDLGDYNICFEARSFDPAPSFNNPVSASATYLGPWNGTTHLGSTTVTAHSTGEPECGRPTRGFVGRMTYWGRFAPEPSAP
ncbi:EGF domain-containing protein [Myxococcus sp. XM-1-1-1]|nr:EGF domain-containing protein [Myxococcus sp. AS-1-15]MBZ4409770.1 EGF domain-containing protein [Myxococcus sp. XM-1-1-1]